MLYLLEEIFVAHLLKNLSNAIGSAPVTISSRINISLPFFITNIYKIAYNVINNKERPNYLSRSNNSSGFLEEFPKSKFTCLEVSFHFFYAVIRKVWF